MNKRYSSEELYAIRSYIPIQMVIEKLLKIPCKEIEGRQRFVCPNCFEMQTGIDLRTNLCRCFGCLRNFNTIDLVMKVQQRSFVESVKLLQAFSEKLGLPKASPNTLGVCY